MERTGRLSPGGTYHGFLLIGYRLFDRATVGTAIDKVMKRRWFVPFSVGAMFAAFVLSAAFFRPKTLQTSANVLGALFGSHHVTGGLPAHDRHDRAHFHFCFSL
jgi:D-alanyl-lipoteichoic acid acyltransferase DltB (MBOAT superfamily)